MLNERKHMQDMDTQRDVSSMGKGLSSFKGYMEGNDWKEAYNEKEAAKIRLKNESMIMR
jgi:hypothetical protein